MDVDFVYEISERMASLFNPFPITLVNNRLYSLNLPIINLKSYSPALVIPVHTHSPRLEPLQRF